MRALFKASRASRRRTSTPRCSSSTRVYPGIFDLLDLLLHHRQRDYRRPRQDGHRHRPLQVRQVHPQRPRRVRGLQGLLGQGQAVPRPLHRPPDPRPGRLAINLESGAVDCIWQPTTRTSARLRDQSGRQVHHRHGRARARTMLRRRAQRHGPNRSTTRRCARPSPGPSTARASARRSCRACPSRPA